MVFVDTIFKSISNQPKRMNIKAYTSVTSEKTTANSSRKLLLEVGAVKYLEMVRILSNKCKIKNDPSSEPIAGGKTAEEVQTWIDVKTSSKK